MDETPDQVEGDLETLKRLMRLRQQNAEWDRHLARNAPARSRPWHSEARPNQLQPPGDDWNVWLFLAGRGFGKTRLAAEWLAEQAATHPGTEWAIIAPTWRDARKTCIEGSKSGILQALLPGELDSVNLSDLTVRLTNGSVIYGYGAAGEGWQRIRGANLSGAWVDEMASMARPEDMFAEALMPALRIGKHPRVLITTTPRPIPYLRELIDRTDGSIALVRGKTWDNAENLSKTALAEMRANYTLPDGSFTRLGRQELEGELIEDIVGALWSREQIDAPGSRVTKVPELARIVVGIDPAVTSGEKSDYTGIVVCGRSVDGHLYVLEDCTLKGTPHHCMTVAVDAYRRWHADRIVAEVNNGGDFLEAVLRTVDPMVPYGTVRATRGKITRAEPIASLWETGRGHIVGSLPKLEDQMCSFTVDSQESPDNLDAMVWAATELQMGSSAMAYMAAISRMCARCDSPNTKAATVCAVCKEEFPREIAA